MVVNLEEGDPWGQAETVAASLGAQPRDRQGIPWLLPIYGRGEAAALTGQRYCFKRVFGIGQ